MPSPHGAHEMDCEEAINLAIGIMLSWVTGPENAEIRADLTAWRARESAPRKEQGE